MPNLEAARNGRWARVRDNTSCRNLFKGTLLVKSLVAEFAHTDRRHTRTVGPIPPANRLPETTCVRVFSARYQKCSDRSRPLGLSSISTRERRRETDKITRPDSAAKRIAIREYLSERRCVCCIVLLGARYAYARSGRSALFILSVCVASVH